MNQVYNMFNTVILQYQNEIHKKNPKITMNELKEIWKKMEENDGKTNVVNSKKEEKKTKKKKTAYQNFFVIARKNVTKENSKLKFGEISKIISEQWNNMDKEDKKKYETKEEDIMSNYIQNENSKDSYIHLFENTNDDDDINHNRIDYEEDEEEIEIDDEDCDDDDLNFDEIE